MFELPGAHGARRIVAVHDRHLTIHQHQVQGLRLNRRNRLCTVVHDPNFDAKGLQQARCHLLVYSVVLDQQHPGARVEARERVAPDFGLRPLIPPCHTSQQSLQLRFAHRFYQPRRDVQIVCLRDSIPERTQNDALRVAYSGVAAQLASQTQSVSAAQGGLGNISLYNQLAQDLNDFTIVIPSLYPPGLVTALDSPETCDNLSYKTCISNSITSRLAGLEAHRQALLANLDTTFTKTDCQGPNNAPIVVRRVLEAAQAFAGVDSFELSLFGGQATQAAQPAPAATMAAAPNSSNQPTPKGQATPTPSSSPNALVAAATQGLPTLSGLTASAPIVQLLSAQLLLAKIHPDVAQSNTATPTPGATPTPFTPPVFMLVAQANESGGSTLTQTSLSEVEFSTAAAPLTRSTYMTSGANRYVVGRRSAIVDLSQSIASAR